MTAVTPLSPRKREISEDVIPQKQDEGQGLFVASSSPEWVVMIPWMHKEEETHFR